MPGKVSTGVSRFDRYTGGGVVRGGVTLLEMGPDADGSSVHWKFLQNGLVKRGEKGLAFAFDHSEQDLIAGLAAKGLDFQEKLGEDLFLYTIDPADYVSVGQGDINLRGLILLIESHAREDGVNRFVLDPIQKLAAIFPDPDLLVRELRLLFHRLKWHGVTSVIVSRRSAGPVIEDLPVDRKYLLEGKHIISDSWQEMYRGG